MISVVYSEATFLFKSSKIFYTKLKALLLLSGFTFFCVTPEGIPIRFKTDPHMKARNKILYPILLYFLKRF